MAVPTTDNRMKPLKLLNKKISSHNSHDRRTRLHILAAPRHGYDLQPSTGQ